MTVRCSAARVFIVACLLMSDRGTLGAETVGADRVEFNRDIRPILSDACFHCHGPDAAQRQANLRLDLEDSARADLGDGRRAIVPGDLNASELLRRVTSTNPEEQMPPPTSGRSITADQIQRLRRWVSQGAKWEQHWSFVAPRRQAVPPTHPQSSWPRSPIDAFVEERLRHEGLVPSVEADAATWLRRVSLDLTGLPPSLEEALAFAMDDSPDACERVVDRLLASPRYGERMAIRWLNAARYADTSGYQSDGERTMWRWRDWVIDAYNQNMPFDQFTVEQLAGDLLPGATLNQKLATGFNRNHRGNAEGGIIPEEFAVEYVVDRVETTSTVWLGLTAMCARCHNHKFDPITQSDFYQLYAYFNNLPEKGRAVKYGNSPPYLLTPTSQQQTELERKLSQLCAVEKSWDTWQSDMPRLQETWERQGAIDRPAADAILRGCILHLPFEGTIEPTVSAPWISSRPAGYLGQTRLLASTNAQASSETGDPRFGDGRFGQALLADGTHYAAVGDVANFGFFDRFTVAAWIKPNRDQDGTILSRMTDVEHGDGWCLVLQGGKLQVHLTKRWLDDACRVETVDALPETGWVHVAMSYNGGREADGIAIAINGIVHPQIVLLDELNQSFDNKAPLRIGAGNGPDGRFRGMIDEVRLFDRVLSDRELGILAEPTRLMELAQIPLADRTPAQSAALTEAFINFAAPPSLRAAADAVHAAREAVERFRDELPTTMVMLEQEVPRPAFVLRRGEYDKRGEQVQPNVPSCLPKLDDSQPSNRLGLARWLVNPQHPLTSRVAVNRLWQMVFGTGLVKTIDDFGQQGDWPSHPELLDWLAVEFRGPDDLAATQPSPASWDVKRLLRSLVTSAVYRQSSRSSVELLQRDPENRLLARGPRFRLPAEMIRDQALAASGLLVEQLGGPSVKPYQPDGLWNDLAGLDYEQDHGPSLYRRGLYTYWKRTVAPPAMVTFDAGGRETCFVKETRTNTPLQALNLMNDVTYVEAARALAERMMTEAGPSMADRIDAGFQLVLARKPQPSEQSVLMTGYQNQLAHFRTHSRDVEALLTVGERPSNSALERAELAATTMIASLILNLDETVVRE